MGIWVFGEVYMCACRPAANTQIRMYMWMARSRTCACTHISCIMISCMCLFKYVRAKCHAIAFCLCIINNLPLH